MSIVLRDFAADDQADFEALVQVGLRERWGSAFDPSYNADLADVRANYLAAGAEVVVGEVEAAGIVATGILLDEGHERGRIVRMSVAATYRRQGFARAVVQELIARARKRDMTRLDVFTDTPWTSAVALYVSCGFEEVGQDETDTYFSMDL